MTDVEVHPWQPFLPKEANLLMLGSFPPPKRRWSMDFYYPNPQNDFWRLCGLIFFDDREYFVLRQTSGKAGFDRRKIESFLKEQKIALYDAAVKIIRHRGTASDNNLEVVEPVDFAALMSKIPKCRTIAVTGGRALSIVLQIVGFSGTIPLGESIETVYEGRSIRIWRMPSTSRAWPKPLEYKAGFYQRLFSSICSVK